MNKTTASKRFEKFVKLAESFGCTVIRLDNNQNVHPRFRAPFSSATYKEQFGLDYKKKVIYFKSSSPSSMKTICRLIHELAHCVVPGREPWCSKEYDFFGWEYIAARKCGLFKEGFIKGNFDYHAGETLPAIPIASISKSEMNYILKARVKEAHLNGYLEPTTKNSWKLLAKRNGCHA